MPRIAALLQEHLLLTTYYLLLATCYLLLTTYYLLLTTCNLLLAACYLLLTAHYFCLRPTTYYLKTDYWYLRRRQAGAWAMTPRGAPQQASRGGSRYHCGTAPRWPKARRRASRNSRLGGG